MAVPGSSWLWGGLQHCSHVVGLGMLGSRVSARKACQPTLDSTPCSSIVVSGVASSFVCVACDINDYVYQFPVPCCAGLQVFSTLTTCPSWASLSTMAPTASWTTLTRATHQTSQTSLAGATATRTSQALHSTSPWTAVAATQRGTLGCMCDEWLGIGSAQYLTALLELQQTVQKCYRPGCIGPIYRAVGVTCVAVAAACLSLLLLPLCCCCQVELCDACQRAVLS